MSGEKDRKLEIGFNYRELSTVNFYKIETCVTLN